MPGFLSAAHHGHGLAPIEHPVTGGAVADAPAQELPFPGVELLSGDAGGNDERRTHIKVAAHRHAKGVAHGHHREGTARNDVRLALLQLTAKELGHFRAGHGRKSRIIGDLFRLIETAGLRLVAHNAHGLAAVEQRQRRGSRRGAAADHDHIIGICHDSILVSFGFVQFSFIISVQLLQDLF